MKFDIKNQFTNLSKDRVLLALNLVLNKLELLYSTRRRLTFAIRRRRYLKYLDTIGHANPNHSDQVKSSEILDYVKFELKNSYFKINKQFFYQKCGLPMGGFMSAVLACIDALTQEHLHPSLWPNEWSCHRYRDDIFIIAPKKLNENSIENIHRNLNILYGPDLSVELEEINYKTMNFLEYNITTCQNKLAISHYNKNTTLDIKKHTVRYPEHFAPIPKSQFISTITGALIRAQKLSNFTFTKITSIFNIIKEFVLKGYNLKLITRGISYLNFNIGINAVNALIAGFFGVPGVIFLIIFKYFL